MFGSMRGVSRRTEAGKSFEIVDEMGLIEIAAIQRYAAPIYFAAHPDVAQNLLKALDAAEKLGRQSNLIVEDIDETAGAEADLSGNLRDGGRSPQVSKFMQSIIDRRMPQQRLTRVSEQTFFQDLKLCIWSRSFE